MVAESSAAQAASRARVAAASSREIARDAARVCALNGTTQLAQKALLNTISSQSCKIPPVPASWQNSSARTRNTQVVHQTAASLLLQNAYTSVANERKRNMIFADPDGSSTKKHRVATVLTHAEAKPLRPVREKAVEINVAVHSGMRGGGRCIERKRRALLSNICWESLEVASLSIRNVIGVGRDIAKGSRRPIDRSTGRRPSCRNVLVRKSQSRQQPSQPGSRLLPLHVFSESVSADQTPNGGDLHKPSQQPIGSLDLCNKASQRQQPGVQCAALLLLADLFAEHDEDWSFGSWTCRDVVMHLLELFETQPTYAEDLVKVALHIQPRTILVNQAILHRGGMLLCEVLLQVVNSGDSLQSCQAAGILAACLALPSSEELLYTNDIRVLVEILEREIPRHAEDPEARHAECLRALLMRCTVARNHRTEDVSRVLEDVRNYACAAPEVRVKCGEAMTYLA